MNALIASLQFISAIPLGRPRPFDPRGIIVSFPLAGLVIGVVLAICDWIFTALWTPAVAGVLDTVLLAAITGALHLDGLADMADGLYGRREREKALAIMKDSRVGAMGLVAVVCVLLTKSTALGHVDHARFLALVLIPAYARSAMIFGIRFLPYARGKEGTGSPFFETPLASRDFLFVAVPVLLSLFLGWRGLLLNLVFALGTAGLIILYQRKLGGITGDLLGAMTEVLEAVLFLAVCVGATP
ncbi:adenosylcobinamide-GDP ribazoletransferase [uncultured Desulfosarcina sp.]|uniref:adenosylcobinamide-GDP ribazoletransferase n=1 Tax=uncultured Desulfosarcina sp. TaxID=218289 RepID=UPI0029C687E7|nr:adenosylcobinamide-GDP ribazoletransferase [uncultured Desulfosarcina sp.]